MIKNLIIAFLACLALIYLASALMVGYSGFKAGVDSYSCSVYKTCLNLK